MKMKPPQVPFVHFCLCFIFSVKLVSGGSWATLASSCPDLKVMLTVEQVINTNHLANILLPEIPLTEYTMAALYYSDDWNATPTLCDMLPRFRRSLQVRLLSGQRHRVQSVQKWCHIMWKIIRAILVWFGEVCRFRLWLLVQPVGIQIMDNGCQGKTCSSMHRSMFTVQLITSDVRMQLEMRDG